MDEVDFILLDRFTPLHALNKPSLVIGLTATAEADLTRTESLYLTDKLGFSIFNSHIPPSIADQTLPVDCDFARFFSSEFANMGRLIYCEQVRFAELRELATAEGITQIHENCD